MERSRISRNKSQTSLPEIPIPVMSENFFDFREKGVDIWDEDNLVANLKKYTEMQAGVRRYADIHIWLGELSLGAPSYLHCMDELTCKACLDCAY